MNIRIDLILDSERRSPSLVNPKTIARVGTIGVPLILAALIFSGLTRMITLKGKLAELKQENADRKAKKELAAELRRESADVLKVRDELRSWEGARLDWSGQLTGIMQHIPTNVMLNNLLLSFTPKLDDRSVPARMFALTLEGRALGEDADMSLTDFRRSLESLVPFGTSVIENVHLRADMDTAPGASSHDRTFRIECTYVPRRFK